MGARYPYYLLADSPEGQQQEAQITRKAPSTEATYGRIRQGFVYKRVPHITLKQIANNAEIDVIWERFQEILEPVRHDLNKALGESWEEWQIRREATDDWSTQAQRLHARWWKARVARQKDIDASIAANAPVEYLYDQPYEDKKVVRVAGPFTVESLSPHRLLAVDENDELVLKVAEPSTVDYSPTRDFATDILDNLRTAGVQQARKGDRIDFSSISGWPGGEYICDEGRYERSNRVRRAGIMIGPEFGTVSRPDLAAAAKEALDFGFDALIACAFADDAGASDFSKVGRMPVLKARMNADLHMATDLKQSDKGNLFVIFGEPDIKIRDEDDGFISVEVFGVDVFDPAKGEVRSDNPGRHRLLVHRHRLQRGELLRAPRLLPRRQGSLQEPEDIAQGRDRAGGVGITPQIHLPTLCEARVRPHRRKGHQPSRRRGHESVPGLAGSPRHVLDQARYARRPSARREFAQIFPEPHGRKGASRATEKGVDDERVLA